MVNRSESELTLDKIVFQNRNKNYGAFDLRREYNGRLRTAILIAILLFTTALLIPVIAKLFKGDAADEDTFKVSEVVLAEPPPIDKTAPPPPPPPEIEPPKIKSTKFLPPVIKPDEEVKEEVEPPKVEELKESTPSNVTQEGNTDNLNEVITSGTGNEEVGEKPDEVVTWVPEQPGFKEGDFNKFIQKSLNYPTKAAERGTNGRVFVEFVIEKDGTVTSVKVSKGIGDGCD
ncbi:MAG TPA: TonB family protein, partial [Cytophagaceae bacterium]